MVRMCITCKHHVESRTVGLCREQGGCANQAVIATQPVRQLLERGDLKLARTLDVVTGDGPCAINKNHPLWEAK